MSTEHTGSASPFEVLDSLIHGKGVFASAVVEPGTIVGEYSGELVPDEEADRRLEERGYQHTVMLSVEGGFTIDGAKGGNFTVFVNHSCDPNCEIEVEGQRGWIKSIRRIEAGEELTVDYSFERDDGDSGSYFPCTCRSVACRGTMLAAETRQCELRTDETGVAK